MKIFEHDFVEFVPEVYLKGNYIFLFSIIRQFFLFFNKILNTEAGSNNKKLNMFPLSECGKFTKFITQMKKNNPRVRIFQAIYLFKSLRES